MAYLAHLYLGNGFGTVADVRELPHGGVILLHPLLQHRGGELARDDGDRYAVAAIVGEPLRGARDVLRRGKRARPERRPQLVVEVEKTAASVAVG